MIQIIDVPQSTTLNDYAAYVHLKPSVEELRAFAVEHVRRSQQGTVWMLNSTVQGGGVAEMMPKLVGLLRELGVRTEWVVMGADDERFFTLTKRLHNMIHGSGTPAFAPSDYEVYQTVSRQVADALHDRIGPKDVLVVHDPQPAAVGALLKEETGIPTVWRSHIGLDRSTPTTQAAWTFLKPWISTYDRVVFSVRDYVPDFLTSCADIIPPAIDPLSAKNQDLSAHKLAGILVNASLAASDQPVLHDDFENPAMRLQPDGVFAPATEPEGLGLLYRPILTEVSRWDRLKGFEPLLEGFNRLKTHIRLKLDPSDLHRRRLDLVRLVLAGPDPASIQDDPEGLEVFERICDRWRLLDPEVQRDVAVLVLPMGSRRINALMVNALQRCSTVVVQNSLREGFGLTVTEAMWKARPVLGTRAVGIREQIRDGIHGRLVHDAEDADEIAAALDTMLCDAPQREAWARNGQQRVVDEYLVFSQARRWIQTIEACC